MLFSELRPYLYGILSNTCFVTIQLFFKMTTLVMDPIQIMDIRSFILLVLNTLLLVRSTQYYRNQKQGDSTSGNVEIVEKEATSLHIRSPKVFSKIIVRMFWYSSTLFFLNAGLKYVPLAINNALMNTSPLVVMFLEAYLYKKKIVWVNLLLTLLAFVGVLMIINPFKGKNAHIQSEVEGSLEYDRSSYVFLPLLAALTASFSMIYTHDLKGKVSQQVMMQYGYIFQTFYFHTLMNLTNSESTMQHFNPEETFFTASIFDPICVGVFILMTILAYAADYFRILALFHLPPSKISPFNYSGIILGLTFDFMIFNHKTDWIQITGIFLASLGLFSQLILYSKDNQKKSQNQGLTTYLTSNQKNKQ